MSLENFFAPQSVAIVGASRDKGKVGYEILASMIDAGFPGDIYPVNPKADEILGLKCYSSLEAIGKSTDLAIIVIPARFVPNTMEQCAKLGVKAAIIISAGFKETGKEGAELEKQVADIARKGGVRIIGPNCLGIQVPKTKLNASFGGDLPLEGSIGYISQSGALMAAILDMAIAGKIGFSKLISVGNKADVDELDLIDSLGNDDDTSVVAGYLESITNGQEFVRMAEKISRKKPILLMKSGGTSAGATAASSHTGSLAGAETAYQCAFDRAGVVRCPSIASQFDYAQAFAYQPLPTGQRVAVITNAGGPGIMAADAIEREGLTFAKLSDSTKKKLAENLPAAANVNNPIDVLGDALADRYEFAMKTVLADDGVDIALVLLTPQVMTQDKETAEAVAAASKDFPNKAVLACFMGAGKVANGIEVLRGERIPQYTSPESAVATIKAVTNYATWRSRPERKVKEFDVDRSRAEKVINEYLSKDNHEIGELDSKEILMAYGFTTPAGSPAGSAEEAANVADEVGYPVVMKIWSPEILHKSDVGGVKLNIGSKQEVIEAYNQMVDQVSKRMPDANILGVTVQQMAKEGREVILGMKRDPQFGPLMMFGLGGIYVEVLKDVTFALAPLAEREARGMIEKTKTYGLLKGARGEQGVDIDALVEGLQRLSQLVTDFPQIQEMDINPFKVGPVGTQAIAVDARITVA